jgi:tRNA G18 (ribose-2'-O)-methylase SpoU
MKARGPDITEISSLDDPRIAEYANLRDRQLRLPPAHGAHRPLPEGGEGEGLSGPWTSDLAPRGLFIAEGDLVVRTLIQSPLRTRSLLLTRQRLESMQDALAALSPGTPVYLVTQELMNQVVGFHIHRGILALGERPSPPHLDDLLERTRTLVILENLANHDNIGGLFRATAALAGLPSSPSLSPSSASPSVPSCPRASVPSGSAVLLSPGAADPLYRKAIRVSMGAALLLPFATLTPWPDSLHSLKAHGFTLIALTPDAAATPLQTLPEGGVGEGLIRRPGLLLGAEGPGLSPEALAAADLRVRIPIDPHIDSLNVVTAAAIALHALQPPDFGSAEPHPAIR